MSADKKEYLVRDLDGCRVVTESGEDLGELKDVYPTGSNDVYVVRSALREMLIPALTSVVLSIDLREKRIVVRLPPGLREVYE